MAIPNNLSAHIQLKAAQFGDSIGDMGAEHMILTTSPNLQLFHIASNMFGHPGFKSYLKEVAAKLSAYADSMPGTDKLITPPNKPGLII